MLRYAYRMRPRRLPKGEGRGSGPQGRINKMRKMVTALIRYERIEGKFPYIEESRGYAERVSKTGRNDLYFISVYVFMTYYYY